MKQKKGECGGMHGKPYAAKLSKSFSQIITSSGLLNVQEHPVRVENYSETKVTKV